MSPCWGGTPAVLRLLGGLTLLLLLLCPHAARGDCSLPPDIPNAQPDLKGLTSFPNKKVVTYKCNKGFVKVPGEPDSVICLENVWSSIKEFCNRSCNVPTRLLFATLKKPYNTQNYFPSGSVVEYECRLGFKRDHSLSGNLTCLQNFTWSKSDEFCKKKSCPNPGKIINGNVIIKTDILYGSSISFSCNTGYKLVGSAFSTCILKGNSTDWSHPLPECKESSPISKPTSTPQKPTTTDVPGTKPPSTPQKSTTVNVSATEVTSTPQKPTTTDVPGTKPPSTPQKSTTVNVSATEATSTLQKPITANVSATEATSTPQKLITAKDSATITKIFPVSNALSAETPLTAQTPIMANSSTTQDIPKTQRFTTAKASLTQSPTVTQKFTTVHNPVTKGLHTTQRLISARITATQGPAVAKTTTSVHSRSTSKGSGTISAGTSFIASGLVAGTIIIGIPILVKFFWDRRKSGSYYTHENHKALNVMFHDLTETDDASEVRPGHTFITLTVLLMALVAMAT